MFSSILGRKAHNGHNENICSAMRQNPTPDPPRGHTSIRPFGPWRHNVLPYRQAEYIFSIKPGIAAFSIQRPTITRSMVLSTKMKLVPFPTCM